MDIVTEAVSDRLSIPYHKNDIKNVGQLVAHHLFRLGYKGRGKRLIAPDGSKVTLPNAIARHVRLVRKSGRETKVSDALCAQVYAWSNVVGLL